MNKKVIYTCCVGGYDTVTQPLAVDEEFDYVCFSNDTDAERIGVWQVRPIPYQDDHLTRLSRFPKIMPHRVLPQYEESVYLDANIQITHQDFYLSVNSFFSSPHSLIAQVRHCLPPVDCIYDEISYAYKCNKITLTDAWRQTRYLKRQRFPRHYGLFENNLICRRHGDALVKTISEQWWEEFVSRVPRDQFSLMYVYWKNGFMPASLFGDDVCTRNSPWLSYHPHTKDKEQEQNLSLSEKLEWHFHTKCLYPCVKAILKI